MVEIMFVGNGWTLKQNPPDGGGDISAAYVLDDDNDGKEDIDKISLFSGTNRTRLLMNALMWKDHISPLH